MIDDTLNENSFKMTYFIGVHQNMFQKSYKIFLY